MYFICVFKIDPMEELFQGTYYGAKILVRKQVEINMTQKFTVSDIRISEYKNSFLKIKYIKSNMKSPFAP